MSTDITTMALQGAVAYGAEALAGHAAVGYLSNVASGFAERGAQTAGWLGRGVGSVLGRAVAGSQLPMASEGRVAIASAAQAVGDFAVGRVMNSGQTSGENPASAAKPADANWKATAWNVAKGAAVVAGSVAAVTAAPIATAAVVSAAVAAVPGIIAACTEEAKPAEKEESFVDAVAVPVAKTLVTKAAEFAVGNMVRYDVVRAAYDSRPAQLQAIGDAIGSYLPSRIGDYAGAAGRLMGQVDAGRYAMSEPVVNWANTAAELSGRAVSTGLRLADTAASRKAETSGWWSTASKAAWIGAGIIGGAALAAASPEIAAVTLGVAAIEMADKGIQWLRRPTPAASKVEQASPVQDVLAKMRPSATLEASTLGIAAAAA